jgi:hypothetical protein
VSDEAAIDQLFKRMRSGDAVFQVGFEHPDWYNGFEHDPEEAARVRVRLLRELAANRESLVATHLSFPSVCHVAVAGDAFRWVPGPWEYSSASIPPQWSMCMWVSTTSVTDAGSILVRP